MANAYVMRTNMSVAIVAMVNHTYLDSMAEAEILDDECVEYNNTLPPKTVSVKCNIKLNRKKL